MYLNTIFFYQIARTFTRFISIVHALVHDFLPLYMLSQMISFLRICSCIRFLTIVHTLKNYFLPALSHDFLPWYILMYTISYDSTYTSTRFLAIIHTTVHNFLSQCILFHTIFSIVHTLVQDVLP